MKVSIIYHAEDNAWSCTFIPPRLHVTFYLKLTNIGRKITNQIGTGSFAKCVCCSFRDLIILLFSNFRKRIFQWDKIDFFFISNRLTPRSSPSSEVNSSSASPEIPCILRKPEVHYRIHKNHHPALS